MRAPEGWAAIASKLRRRRSSVSRRTVSQPVSGCQAPWTANKSALHLGPQRHPGQGLQLGRRQPRARPLHRPSRGPAEARGRDLPGHGPIVIAGDPDRVQPAHDGEALGRVGMIADDVAQADDAIDLLLGDIPQHGLQRFEVGVDVGDDRVSQSSVPVPDEPRRPDGAVCAYIAAAYRIAAGCRAMATATLDLRYTAAAGGHAVPIGSGRMREHSAQHLGAVPGHRHPDARAMACRARCSGLRANMEGFPDAVTGLVMSGYYVGLLDRLLARAGAGGAGRACAGVRGPPLARARPRSCSRRVFVEPVAWFLMRLLTGYCFAGAFIVAESWLNGSATNESRGQILSLYMVVQMGGMAAGQFLLNLADPRGLRPVHPGLGADLGGGRADAADRGGGAGGQLARAASASLALYRLSPLGVVGIVGVGVGTSGLFSMGPVYATQEGLSVAAISTFMAAVIMGGVVFQMPVGRLLRPA